MAATRISVSEWKMNRWNIKREIETLRALRLTSLGVCRGKVADFRLNSVYRALQKIGAAPAYVCWAGGFTGLDGYSYDDAMEDAMSALKVCRALQANSLVLLSGGRGGHTLNHAKGMFYTAVSRLLEHAEAWRITLAIQPLPQPLARRYSLLTTLDSAIEFVQHFDHPAVRLALDCDAWDGDKALQTRANELAQVSSILHLAPPCETMRAERGQKAKANTQLEVVRRFAVAGYTGVYDLKLSGLEATARTAYLEKVRHAVEQLQEAAVSPSPTLMPVVSNN